MSSEEHRSLLPSERYSRVKQLRLQEAGLSKETEAVVLRNLIDVPPDNYVPQGDNWVCHHPDPEEAKKGVADPGWVSRVGQMYSKQDPKVAASALAKIITAFPVSRTEQLDAALELVLAVIQGAPEAAVDIASADDGSKVLTYLFGAAKNTATETAKGRVVFNALSVAAYLLRRSSEATQAEQLPSFMGTIKTRLTEAKSWSATTNPKGRIAVRILAEGAVKALSILAEPLPLREKLVKEGFGPKLTALLAAPGTKDACDFCSEIASNFQFVYEASLVLWLLSYNSSVCEELYRSCMPPKETGGMSDIIPMLNALVKKQRRDKCVRVAMLTLKNFMRHHQENPPAADGVNYVKDMISVGMLTTLQMLQKRAFGDEEIIADVQELYDLLEHNAEDLSSYQQYKEEITSGDLQWSPPHTSDKFWRENVRSFEDDSYDPIYKIADIISSNSVSARSLHLQIACHDLGEFVRHHPNGRRLWEMKLKDRTPGAPYPSLKVRLMELIEGKEEAEGAQPISRQALLCMQKILVRKWDHLDRAN